MPDPCFVTHPQQSTSELEHKYHWAFTPPKRPKRRDLAGPDKVLKITSKWTLQFKTIKHSRVLAQDRRSEATKPYPTSTEIILLENFPKHCKQILELRGPMLLWRRKVKDQNCLWELSNLTYNSESAEREPSWTDLVNSTARELNPPEQHSELNKTQRFSVPWFVTLNCTRIVPDVNRSWCILESAKTRADTENSPKLSLQLRTPPNGNPSWDRFDDFSRMKTTSSCPTHSTSLELPATKNTKQDASKTKWFWCNMESAMNSPELTKLYHRKDSSEPSSFRCVEGPHTQQTLSLHQSSQQRSWNLHA